MISYSRSIFCNLTLSKTACCGLSRHFSCPTSCEPDVVCQHSVFTDLNDLNPIKTSQCNKYFGSSVDALRIRYKTSKIARSSNWKWNVLIYESSPWALDPMQISKMQLIDPKYFHFYVRICVISVSSICLPRMDNKWCWFLPKMWKQIGAPRAEMQNRLSGFNADVSRSIKCWALRFTKPFTVCLDTVSGL